MRSPPSLARRVPVQGAAMLLGLTVLASPVAAADDDMLAPSSTPAAAPSSTPAAAPSSTPAAAPASEVVELGGAWRRMAPGPFGAADVPGGWTGTELVVVDPQQKRRAAAYFPALDSWRTIARPPRKVQAGGQTHWTGTELLFVDPRGAARRGLVAYDPVADTWRSTTPSPINEIGSSVWADGALVVTSGSGAASARYDPADESWVELPPVPVPGAATEVSTEHQISLYWTGETVFALSRLTPGVDDPPVDAAAALALVPLDLGEGKWGDPSIGPLSEAAADPLWTGDAFVFMTGPRDAEPTLGGRPTNGSYDPASSTWSITDNACGLDTSEAVWTGSLALAVDQGQALDPVSGQCYTLPLSPWPERSEALQVWTGLERLDLSGASEAGKQARRDGVAYSPLPGEGYLGVAVDKPSRPVRVRIPSLGIDLPIISDERGVNGSSPGYPACDVALSWSFFEMPGKPGTSWVLAHAQEGMFLPLLETLRTQGKDGLIGLTVELQLRDGRLFTYRTQRVNPRATNVSIGIKGRREGEHRLVLQTSTGVGSAPKLLVAARLVDVAMTDEPRPLPKPRACG